jgi:hypothetical protein
MAAISSFESRSPSGGIICSGFVVVIRRTSSLAPPFPETIAGPKSPPLSMAARESSRRPDSWASAPWHSTQRAVRIARAGACASCALSAAACGPPPAVAHTTRRQTKTNDRCGWVIDDPPQEYEPLKALLVIKKVSGLISRPPKATCPCMAKPGGCSAEMSPDTYFDLRKTEFDLWPRVFNLRNPLRYTDKLKTCRHGRQHISCFGRY